MGVVQSAIAGGALLLLGAGRGGAQTPDSLPAGAWRLHVIHVAPHLLVLDPKHRSAVLTFTNTGNAPTEADVRVELGYLYFPSTDTALFSHAWTWAQQEPRDTLIAAPGPRDHYAGAWFSGLPTHLRLAPNQTIRTTVQITPPPDLPDGEYYARVVTAVRPPGKPKSRDVKQQYNIPVTGKTLPFARDSVWVYYRQGPQRMGLTILQAEAAQDTTATARAAFGTDPSVRVVRFLIRYHLSGTTHFEGRIEVSLHGQVIADANTGTQDAFPLYRDGIMRWLVAGTLFTRGRDSLVVRFLDWQNDFPANARVPMDTAQVTIPFDIHR